jgi:3-deoxy-D-manno-octulosonate 8-phosphate phosphatase (KDO 8-P phosphatase)
MKELKVTRLYEGVGDKALILWEMMADLALTPEQVAYVGDDINDLPAFSVAGVRIAVADAALPLRSRAHFVTGKPGGRGAVREAIERILIAQGRYEMAVEAYLTQNRAGSRQ